MISIKLLSALNYAYPGEVDTLCDWLETGVIEPAFYDREGDTIALLRLSEAGRELWPLSLPAIVA